MLKAPAIEFRVITGIFSSDSNRHENVYIAPEHMVEIFITSLLFFFVTIQHSLKPT